MRVIKYQASLNAFGSVSADISFVQKVASSLDTSSSLISNLQLAKTMESSIMASSLLNSDLKIAKTFESLLNANGTLVSDLKIAKTFESSLNANGTLVSNATIAKNLASSLTSSNSLAANALVSKLASASLTGAGTTAANLTVTSSATLLLDLYPDAAAAYSLRKLRSAYTGNAIRVRRSSDNTEQDIGFTALNVLDEAALTTFCGAGNGFVTTWYDQSGNANNAFQTTQSAQPQIVSSGSLITRNSKPYIRATSLMELTFNDLNAAINTNYSFWLTYEKDRTGNQSIILKSGTSYHWLDYGTAQTVSLLDNITITSLYNINTLYLTNIITNYSLGATLYRNGASIGTRGALTSPAVSNKLPAAAFRTAIITFTEFIYYSYNQSTHRTGIETNINTHYAIY